MIPGLLMPSLSMAVVSTVPGAHVLNTCHRGSVGGRFAPKIFPIWMYWLPVVSAMFAHVGWFGSAGGCAASSPAWHPAHDTPTRIGELVALGGCAALNAGLGNSRTPT